MGATILNDDPTLNLLIDSNNDGSPNEADDPIEENAPGKYMLVNGATRRPRRRKVN